MSVPGQDSLKRSSLSKVWGEEAEEAGSQWAGGAGVYPEVPRGKHCEKGPQVGECLACLGESEGLGQSKNGEKVRGKAG